MNIDHVIKNAYKRKKFRYDEFVSSNLLKKLDFPAAEKLAGFFLPQADTLLVSAPNSAMSLLIIRGDITRQSHRQRRPMPRLFCAYP